MTAAGSVSPQPRCERRPPATSSPMGPSPRLSQVASANNLERSGPNMQMLWYVSNPPLPLFPNFFSVPSISIPFSLSIMLINRCPSRLNKCSVHLGSHPATAPTAAVLGGQRKPCGVRLQSLVDMRCIRCIFCIALYANFQKCNYGASHLLTPPAS